LNLQCNADKLVFEPIENNDFSDMVIMTDLAVLETAVVVGQHKSEQTIDLDIYLSQKFKTRDILRYWCMSPFYY